MPSEQSLLDPPAPVPVVHLAPQAKLCTACHSPVLDAAPALCPDEPLVCARCRAVSQQSRRLRPDDFLRHRSYSPVNGQATSDPENEHAETSMSSCSSSPVDHPLDFLQQQHSVSSPARVGSSQIISSAPQTFVSPPSRQFLDTELHREPHVPTYADPLVDITRIRMRPQSHHCLYPGATFQGTQKSGRNSYDVSVTIVDVNLPFFLCGYLRIRGLTDDWPELTTYFDAEVIGSRHGFLTQKWGADENHDMMHWSRFPAFRHVKNELKQPNLTMSDLDRGAVFMRWKEKFLVPDHRVQDVNGASFAGFYYVCVDFNPPCTNARPTPQETAGTGPNDSEPALSAPALKGGPQHAKSRRGRRSSNASPAPRTSAPVATMNGFYYHQNSEPYQQLSLHHVPETSSSIFEFR